MQRALVMKKWSACCCHGAQTHARPITVAALLYMQREIRKLLRCFCKLARFRNVICFLRYFDEALGWHFAGSPLHTAGNDIALIRILVGHGAQLETSDHITTAALHYAAARGNIDAVKALLEFDADPNAMCELVNYGTQNRMTPLHYAARQGHKEIVQALLKSGAQPGLLGGNGSETAADLGSGGGVRRNRVISGWG